MSKSYYKQDPAKPTTIDWPLLFTVAARLGICLWRTNAQSELVLVASLEDVGL